MGPFECRALGSFGSLPIANAVLGLCWIAILYVDTTTKESTNDSLERVNTMQRRNAMITAASVAAVVLTAATAVGANMGILSSADESPLGTLAANVPVAVTEPEVVDIYLDDAPAPTDTTTGFVSQEFAVDAAGSVVLDSTSSTLRLGAVNANDGWTWSSSQTSDSELIVTFVSDSATLELVAALGPDGTVQARVDQPVIVTETRPGTVSPASATYSDDQHESDDLYEGHEGSDADD